MNKNQPQIDLNPNDYQASNEDMWYLVNQSNQLMIPIELDTKDQIVGLYLFENHTFPIGGQKHLFEITGSPFTTKLAAVKVFHEPISPSLHKNYEKALMMLANAIDRCDSSNHSNETSLWAGRIAEHLGLPNQDVSIIKKAAKLHDIGKAVVPRELLIKPGPLTIDEWEIIRRHPAYGANLMEPIQSLNAIQPLVRSHHEHFSGEGYPDGLSAEEIPLGARIISVADAFSTMVTRRIYRSPISSELARRELLRCRGTQFDPRIVDHMLELLTEIN
ncbi:MAG TPA: HD domain-containing phosphohydrolase [Anaerolineaceae bacterium]|nr:HD domain-containing phosphohydrolase [Anaerolineaceae bacterium]